jgi:hypothetical protein
VILRASIDVLVKGKMLSLTGVDPWSACTQNVCYFRDERQFFLVGYLTTVSEYNSDYVELNGGLTGKNLEGSSSNLNDVHLFIHVVSLHLPGRIGEITRNLSQDSRWPVKRFQPSTSQYKSGTLPLEQSVQYQPFVHPAAGHLSGA